MFFSRTIVEVQNKSIPNVLDFVNSTLASVNKHQRPAPHPLVYIPIARSTKKKISLVYLEPKAAYIHEYPSRQRDEISCLVCKSKREESYA